ncbi:MAG: hypothetical protein AB7T06_41175 [Kofleriaceae bacterium]
MSGIHPVGTVCYQLLVKPSLGSGLGNTVYVGLDVTRVRERTHLQFSGLKPRVLAIRAALDKVTIFDGGFFNTTGPVTAEELRSAMHTRRVAAFRPTLVRGQEILDELGKPA